MQITIGRKGPKWTLRIAEGEKVEYGTLYKLGKALVLYAKGQKL